MFGSPETITQMELYTKHLLMISMRKKITFQSGRKVHHYELGFKILFFFAKKIKKTL
jgi:hypothetical protein